MKDVKNELEDLSLKYSNPEAFQQVKAIVAQKKDEREEYLDHAVKKIYSSAEKLGISVSISSRAKHFYSIYQKMRKRNKGADELYDLLALRVICQTVNECYTLIGIVHSLWKPMDGRFKDYIAMPKANGYQSLHTTVICEGKPLEIQIRTAEMHNKAEHGVASHWLYKKGTNHDKVDISDLGIVNQLQNLKNADMSDEGTSTRPVRSGEKMALAVCLTFSACASESEKARRMSFVTWSPPTPSVPAWIMRPSANAA